MNARRWPSDSSRDVTTTTTADPAVLAPAPDLPPMTLEAAEDAERKLAGDLALARAERDDATAALSKAKASLPDAASRGFEAARGAQRTISEAEERLRAAESVTSALEAALRPVAEERWRLAKIRLREQAGERLAEVSRERAAVDAEIVAALDALALVAARRDALTADALGIIESVARDGGDSVGSIERSYYGSHVREAASRLPGSLRLTLST